MSEQATQNHDKTIVQRRVAHANDMSRKAVKDVRAGLNSGPKAHSTGHNGFNIELLQKHARLQKTIGVANIVLFAIAAAVAHLTLPLIVTGAWFVLGVLTVGGINLAARKYLSSEPDQINPTKWEQKFLLLHLAMGIVWASLYGIYPLHTANGDISLLVLCSSLVISALSLISARYLKFGVLLTAAPATIVVAVLLIRDMSIASLSAAALAVGTLLFFQRLGNILRDGYLDLLTSRAERSQLIMELEASRAISEEARRRAEEANLAKSRFLATMSHELRTPLNAILGFSEVMTNEVMGPIDNPNYKEYLGDIHRSGSHLLKLINEILDLSRVEAGRYELNEEATNLAHAAEESQQMIKLKATEKNVSLIMQIQPDLPQIWADARAVRQVILNLLSNALKFTPAGGTIWLKVGWTASGGQYVSIKDTGPGIPEDEIPIVLSSFGQGSIAIKSAEQGTGLGLPIVQALVHMHDGTFDLKSKLRQGTEVIATFPRERVMEVMSAMPVEGGGENSAFKNQRRRVKAPGMSA